MINKIKTFCRNKQRIIIPVLVFLASFSLIFLYVNVFSSSDYPSHIRSSLRGDGYSLISFLVIISYKLTGSSFTFVLVMSLITTLTVYGCAFYIKTILSLLGEKVELYKIIPVSSANLFICKLCIPEWSGYYYEGSLVTQPWHNSTYTAMRLFAIITMAYYFLIENEYKENINMKYCVMFSLFLLLSNLSKPNFIIVFAPVMLFVLIYDFIKTRTKSFRNAFIFGMCIVVTLFVLVIQYTILFSASDGSGTILSFDNAIGYISKDKKFILYLLLNYCFPLYASYLIVVNKKRIKQLYCRPIIENWLMAVFSILVYLFIVETGHRSADGNFGWGMPFFAYSLFSTCLAYLYVFHKNKAIDDKHYQIGKTIYLLHIIFGLFYFGLLLMGYLSWGI